VLGVLLGVAHFEDHDDDDDGCGAELLRNTVGFLVTLCVTVLLELLIVVVSMRGSILNVQPRSVMPYIVYMRLGMSLARSALSFYDRIACVALMRPIVTRSVACVSVCSLVTRSYCAKTAEPTEMPFWERSGAGACDRLMWIQQTMY